MQELQSRIGRATLLDLLHTQSFKSVDPLIRIVNQVRGTSNQRHVAGLRG